MILLFYFSCAFRADFLEIVRDLHVRSSALEKTKAKVNGSIYCFFSLFDHVTMS